MTSSITRPLEGKIALITGASAGIGASTAQHLSSLGARIVVNYARSSAPAEALVQQLGGGDRAVAIQANAGNVADIKRLVDETVKWGGKIDILIANAAEGALTYGLDKIEEADFERVVELNVKGPLFLVKAAIPHMPPQSHILLVSSTVTSFSSISPNYLLYAMTKGAIEQMTRVVAKDLAARSGILVNCIAPGPTGTALFYEGKSEEVVQRIAGANPFNRLAEPEEIARTVGWLVGGGNTWVTGQVVRCNGGMAV